MSKNLIKTLIIFLSISKQNIALGQVCEETTQSIYTINDGYVIYTYESWFTYHIAVDFRKNLSDKPANWCIHYFPGYMTFESEVYKNYCITYEGNEEKVGIRKCDENNGSQRFELIATSSGASLIRVRHQNQCIYVYHNERIYTKNCPTRDEVENWWLFYFIPPKYSLVKQLN